MVELYRASALTQARFAREQGLKLSTLRQWIYRSTKPPRPAPSRFQEVFLGAPPVSADWSAEVSFATGVTLRLGNSATPELIGHLLQRLSPIC